MKTETITSKSDNRSILNTVDNQLRRNSPPEVKETYARLLSQGYSDKDARQLIGSAFSIESFMILMHHELFDLARYVATLRNLPRLPYSHA